MLNPNQTERQVHEGLGCRVQWAGRGGGPGHAPPTLKILRPRSWYSTRCALSSIPSFGKLAAGGAWGAVASESVCSGLGTNSVELHGGEGAGIIVPQAASCCPEGPLSHSGRRLTLFSVLAGEGRMPEAGGPQGTPAAAALAAGLPAALSSIATATGDQTAAARAEASGQRRVDSFPPSGGQGMTTVNLTWPQPREGECH